MVDACTDEENLQIIEKLISEESDINDKDDNPLVAAISMYITKPAYGTLFSQITTQDIVNLK